MAVFQELTLNLNLGLFESDLGQSNPAAIAPKANLANVVSFHWGRSADPDQCRPHVRGYTDWTSDVGIGNDVYLALPTMEIRNFRIHGGTQSKAIKIKIPDTVEPIDTLARTFPHAPVRVRFGQVDPDNPQQTFKELAIGDVTRVSKGRSGRSRIVELEISTYKERLNVSLGIIADTTCAWTFGDKNCCIDLGPLPVIETFPRLLLINDNIPLASALEKEEGLENVVIFTGEGEIASVNSHVSDDTLGLKGGFVDPQSGDFFSCAEGDLTDGFAAGRLYNGITKRKIWNKFTLDDLFGGSFLPNGGDVIVGGRNVTETAPLHRFGREFGISKWAATPSSFSSSSDVVKRVENDGVDAFALIQRTANGPDEFVTRVDISDGSELDEYLDTTTTTTIPVYNGLLLEGSDLYVCTDFLGTSGGNRNLWKWAKSTPGTPTWSALIPGADIELKDIAFFSGSLWVVGEVSGGDNLWEINPATGAVLNSFQVVSAVDMVSISIDATTGIGFVAGDVDSVGRVHVIDFGADPSTVLASYYDTLVNHRDPVICRVLPNAPGIRVLRTIDTISGPLITFLEALPDPNATGTRFARGYVENDDIRIMIREQVSLTSVQVTRDPPPEWTPGLKITLTPGSDKTIENCRAEWDNEEHFGGIGYGIPRYNPLFESS